MWKPVANLLFTLALILILSAGMYTSLGWPRETALFPQALGGLILVLSLIYCVKEFRRLRSEGWTWIGADTEIATAAELAEAGRLFAWVSGYGLAIWIFGFHFATLAYLFLFLRFKARLSLVASIVSAAVAVAALYGFFNLLLHESPYDGLIIWWLDR